MQPKRYRSMALTACGRVLTKRRYFTYLNWLRRLVQFSIVLLFLVGNIFWAEASPLPGDDLRRVAIVAIDVKGKVVNEQGEPVVGATVQVKGTKKGTTTNEKGEFSLKGIASDAVLVISGSTIEPYEEKIEGRSSFTIKVKKREEVAEAVKITGDVRTGYQRIGKERFVGAVATLDSAAFHRRAGMSILERLDGTVTGVLFNKKGASNLQIRGISTLELGGATSAPLLIVDNFPFTGSLNDINPNDVESITILKDAAAASIWGSRAGNGVIVITTKKGRYNQPFRISVSSNVTATAKPNLFIYPKMSTSDFIDVERFLYSRGGYDAAINPFNPSHPVVSPVVELLAAVRSGKLTQEAADARINSLRSIDARNDLNKYVYQESFVQQHYLNLSGGTNNMNYVITAGYNYTGARIQGAQPSEQLNLNAINSFKLTKRLEVQAGLNFNQNIAKANDFVLPSPLYPYAQLVDAAGNVLAVPNKYRLAYVDTAGGGQLLDWQYRPLDEIRLADNSMKSHSVRFNLNANYLFNSWLNFSLQYNYNLQRYNSRNYYSPETFAVRDLINSYTDLRQSVGSVSRYPIPLGGILDLSDGQSKSYNVRGQININKSWGGKHAITSMLSGEVSEASGGYANRIRLYGYNNIINSYVSTINYDSAYRYYVDTSQRRQIPLNTAYDRGGVTRFVSLVSNVSYTYQNRYTIYGSVRRDGSNLFGVNTNNRWKPLWSVGTRWDISKESFYRIQWMSSLVFRATYGYAGNSGGATAYTTILYPSGGIPLVTRLPYAQVSSAPNPDLRWEKVRTINLGFDFGIFKNRLSGSLDVFNKRSTDVISRVPFDPTSGINEYTVNAASLKTNGFELNVRSTNIISGAFRWETSLGLSYANSIVTDVYQGGFTASDFISYGLHPSVGKPAYSIAAYRWSGLDPATGAPRGWLNGQISTDYNQIFEDSVENQVFIGSSIPLYSSFMTNSISWKNFNLSANITGRFGFWFRKASIRYAALFGGIGHADYSLRWQEAGDEDKTNVPSLVYPVPAGRDAFYEGSEVNVLRGDNIRLQDIRLGYNWVNNKGPRSVIKGLQFSVYVNNLNMILWRAEQSVYDPDFAGAGDLEAAPPEVTWNFGLGVNFLVIVVGLALKSRKKRIHISNKK